MKWDSRGVAGGWLSHGGCTRRRPRRERTSDKSPESDIPNTRQHIRSYVQDPARLQAHQLPTSRQPQVQHIPRPSVPSLPRQAFSRSTCSVVVQTSPVQPISPSAQFPTERFQTLRRHVKPSSNRTGPGLQRILPQTGLGWNRKVVLPFSKQGKPPPEGCLSNDWAGRPKLGGQGAMLHLEPASAESVASCYSVSLLRPFCPCLPLTRAC
jgi:hypothetical protein